MNNNKGFSLIELLVAIGISGIVILMISFIMVQGTTLFKGENEVIDIQSEMQVVRNQISETLMGAKTIVVVKAKDGMVIYTGAVEGNSNELKANIDSTLSTERIITYVEGEDSNSLYISSSIVNATSEGNLISDCISDLKLEFDEGCAVFGTGGNVINYLNPFSVNVGITIESGSHKSDIDMNVRVRNILKEVLVYNTESYTDVIETIENKERYQVK